MLCSPALPAFSYPYSERTVPSATPPIGDDLSGCCHTAASTPPCYFRWPHNKSLETNRNDITMDKSTLTTVDIPPIADFLSTTMANLPPSLLSLPIGQNTPSYNMAEHRHYQTLTSLPSYCSDGNGGNNGCADDRRMAQMTTTDCGYNNSCTIDYQQQRRQSLFHQSQPLRTSADIVDNALSSITGQLPPIPSSVENPSWNPGPTKLIAGDMTLQSIEGSGEDEDDDEDDDSVEEQNYETTFGQPLEWNDAGHYHMSTTGGSFEPYYITEQQMTAGMSPNSLRSSCIPYRRHVNNVQSSSTTTTTKKKTRRRIPTPSQRKAANIRERKRMCSLNQAFDILRKRVPTFAYEKHLSRIETLRLAISYISFMDQLLTVPLDEAFRHYGNAPQEMSAKWSATI